MSSTGNLDRSKLYLDTGGDFDYDLAMPKIVDIKAYQVPDSKNEPTIQTTVFLEDNVTGTFTTPSGSSVGQNEAVALKNEEGGKESVSLAISNLLNIILPHLRGLDSSDQAKIDSLLLRLDGTKNKSNLGGNTLISVSAAIAVATANHKKIPLYYYLNGLFIKYFKVRPTIPQPMFLMLEGGVHGLLNVDFQEFLLVANGFARVFEARIAAKQIFYLIEETLDKLKIPKRYGLEGALAPLLPNNKQALELITKAIGKTSFKIGEEFNLAIDCAASQFKKGNYYHLRDFESPISSEQLLNYYQQLVSTYHLFSLEDPFDQNDLQSWLSMVREKLTSMTVGDDLTCSNPYLITKAIDANLINGVVIKPNQIGTVTEAFQACAIAKKKGLKLIASHRSGESFDTFIADFAVAVGADYIKAGGFTQKVREVKYERLIKIEEEIYR